jgi:SRSO17 transposase
VVLMDASYGSDSGLREAITGLRLAYVVAVVSTVKVRPVRKGDPKPRRLSVEALALKLPKHAWRTITWREGTNKSLQSRFARVRVAPQKGEARFAEETRLIEWAKGEATPTRFWLATVDRNMSFRGLVDLAKLRWRIERDYHDLKQEIGLWHYEGRGWRGFHHHGTLSIAAYGFLIFERERIPLQDDAPALESKNLPFQVVIDPAAPPIRPQRHVPNSIATIRRLLAVAIAMTLHRCECCIRRFPRNQRRNL